MDFVQKTARTAAYASTGERLGGDEIRRRQRVEDDCSTGQESGDLRVAISVWAERFQLKVYFLYLDD